MADQLIAMSFDDGPDTTTGDLLAILKDLRVYASFFLCGGHVRAYTQAARAIVAGGHETGNHSYDHTRMDGLDEGAVRGNFERAAGAIFEITGRKPSFIRVPYMSYGEAVFKAAADMNMPVIGCDVIGYDWEETADTARIVQNVLAAAKDGGIILLHEPYAKTRAALPPIVNTLRSRGYDITTVGALAAQKQITLKAGVCYNAL
ncbi:MAG: polysaccharide deacetylase family protein [Treponema sp.]|jgi:peptidoglycan/xylan/chitin deacetylase (PgdA/CDA1 family)|nr:polysaccharide deacetylase family protein [Treponema sp.]